MWKERHVETEVQDITHRLDLAAEHIHGVRDDLEDIERYTHRQDDRINTETPCLRKAVPHVREYVKHPERSAEQVVDHVREEVRVLEIAE